MRAKHPEMASDQAKMGLKWGVLASESTRIIEKRALAGPSSFRVETNGDNRWWS